MNRKILSAALALSLLLGAACMPSAAKDDAERGDRVTIIVETEGVPLLQTKNAVRLGASEYMKTAESAKTEDKLLSLQEEVKAEIERRVREDADAGFTYTSVINGFSMEAYNSDIEKIKSIDGVKNVYVAETFEVPDLMEADGEPGFGAQMMNAQAMYDAGYDGRGQAVAILDGAFDVGHEFFASPIVDARLSKDDIRAFIENNELNVNVAANQVYKNEKIPFAYDYGENDADAYNSGSRHGTHVAGIAAGKNGVFGGTTFSGAAPESQLILMKISGDDNLIKDDAMIAAMDDASKMDICAVNISVGSTSTGNSIKEKAVNNLRNAGISVVCGGGNSDRSEETVENPDYVYPFFPASFSSATSVASIDTDKRWEGRGKITLGSGEELVVAAYMESLFTKFSDKFYEYVFVRSEEDLTDVKGKVVVAPLNSVDSAVLLKKGVLGIIYISDDETEETVRTVSSEIPAIKVRNSYGGKFIDAENKTLKTDAERIYVKADVPDAGMSSFTNWGTNTSLELKPEITAPGKSILSSVPDDKYESLSGTSMATPQITGAIALMNGFVSDKYPGVTGPDKVSLMENLLMSSARIIFQDSEKTLPESPRRQGAGLADLKAAMSVPVILKGDGGKSKLSLKDMLTDDLKLTFTAKNLTDSDVTYDDIKLYALTDDYKEEEGKNVVAGSTALRFTSDAPESVTVPAGGEKEITVNVKLDSEQTAKNKEIFTNGFWVDGFVVLGSKDGSAAKTSIPFTGFYGDWTAFGAMTPSYFEEGGSVMNGYMALLGENKYIVLGTNPFVEYPGDKSGYESEDYVGWSTLKIGYCLLIRARRNLMDVTVATKDDSGEIIREKRPPNGICRRVNDDCVAIFLDDDLPDGDYSVTVSGRLAYDSDRSGIEEKTYKFYVDSIPPQAKDLKIYEDNGRRYASFEASDNRYLMGAEARDANGGYETAAVKAEKNAKIVLDITGMDEKSLEFTVMDYAYNENKFRIGSVSAEITGKVKEGDIAAFIVSVMNTDAVVDADVIMALYSRDGRLIGVKTRNEPLESGEKETLSFIFDDAAEAVEARLFVWKHRQMTPICEPVVMTEL